MRKFILSIISPIYKEIAGVQLKYQKLSSQELMTLSSLSHDEVEIDFILLQMSSMDNSIASRENSTVELQLEYESYVKHLLFLKERKRFFEFRKKSTQHKLELILKEKNEFERKYPEFFPKLKK